MKSIIVGNINGLQQGKTAIATTLTPADTYRIGGCWYPAAKLEHGTTVEAINVVGRHTFEQGQQLTVKSIGGPKVEIRIVNIEAVEPDKLTDDDYKMLGYADKAEYMSDWGDVFGSKVWLFKVRRL